MNKKEIDIEEMFKIKKIAVKRNFEDIKKNPEYEKQLESLR